MDSDLGDLSPDFQAGNISVLKGHVEKGQLDFDSIEARHKHLVKEMQTRGINHNSPMDVDIRKMLVGSEFVTAEELRSRIDGRRNVLDLFNRCEKCKKRMIEHWSLE